MPAAFGTHSEGHPMETKTGLGPEAIAPILAELKAGLQAIYGERLRGVILFGSYARGEAQPDSDIDVAVVLEDYRSVFEETMRTGALTDRLSLDNATLVTLLYVNRADYLDPWQPVHLDVRLEGVSL
jgi:predicted nucleotidyltransferase